MLAPKSFYPGFEQAPTLEQKKKRLPLVDLPIPIEEIVKDLDAVILTHITLIIGMNLLLKRYLNIFQSLSKMLLTKN